MIYWEMLREMLHKGYWNDWEQFHQRSKWNEKARVLSQKIDTENTWDSFVEIFAGGNSESFVTRVARKRVVGMMSRFQIHGIFLSIG